MHNVFISCKESRIENSRSFYGCFNIGPFDSTQSLTIGNALRRTLLSECEGLGISSVMIENVYHEYSTLPGMRESVLDLLLNLKEIVFTMTPPTTKLSFDSPRSNIHGEVNKEGIQHEVYKKSLLVNNMSSIFEDNFDLVKTTGFNKKLIKSKDIFNLLISKRKHFKKPLIGYLKVKGPGIIRAKDLKLPPFIQCVDANQYVATLAEDGFLYMKFIIMEGKGYIIQKNQVFNKSLSNQLITKRADFVSQIEKTLDVNTQILKENKNNPNTNTNLNISKHETLTNLEKIKVKNKETTLNTSISKSKSASSASEKGISEAESALFNPLTKITKISRETAQFNSRGAGFANFKEKFNFQPGFHYQANNGLKTNFVNCKPLSLDCVFNPVTKVSYIIEDFDNKLINDFNYSFNFANDVSSLMESSYYLQNFKKFYDITVPPPTAFSQTIVNLVDSYSKDEMQELLTYLNNSPLKKPQSLHNIILEIWTNGGIHPREALTVAFQNLSSLFLNLNKL